MSGRIPKPEAALVFLHGLKSHSGWFLETEAALAERGVRVYLFDRRGSGKSEAPRGHIDRYQDWLEDIAAVVAGARRENPGLPIHLLGHCFGAKQALAYTLQYPETVHSLILIAPPQFSLKADLNFSEKLKVLWTLVSGRAGKVRVPIADEMFTRIPEKLEFIRQDPLRLQEMSTRMGAEIFKMDRRINAGLGKIHLPILTLLAQHDEVVDNEKILHKLLPRLGSPQKVSEIYPCQHDLFFEPYREKVWDRIRDWLQAGFPLSRE